MRVLLVDDDELSLEMMETLLEFNDFEAVKCYDPCVAIEKIKTEKFDVIITDYMMPGMNGITFIEKIRDFIGSTKIVFTTAYMKNLFTNNTKNQIVDRVFNKPVDVNELINYLSEVKNLILLGQVTKAK